MQGGGAAGMVINRKSKGKAYDNCGAGNGKTDEITHVRILPGDCWKLVARGLA